MTMAAAVTLGWLVSTAALVALVALVVRHNR